MFIRRTQTRRAKDGSTYSTTRLVHSGGHGAAPGAERDPVAICPESMALARARSVGVEQIGLWAMQQTGLMPLLETLGVNGALRSAATGLIVGRLAHPASERETHRWLAQDSALGELLGVDYESMGAMQLYRASDALVKHRDAIEAHLYERAMNLFGLCATVTLFDLTNTYFEGDAAGQPLARHGHSKEKRSDCPLFTLGLVLDDSGFVSRYPSPPPRDANCIWIAGSAKTLAKSFCTVTPRSAPRRSAPWSSASAPATKPH